MSFKWKHDTDIFALETRCGHICTVKEFFSLQGWGRGGRGGDRHWMGSHSVNKSVVKGGHGGDGEHGACFVDIWEVEERDFGASSGLSRATNSLRVDIPSLGI